MMKEMVTTVTSYALIAVFGILILDTELANGLKCHVCDDCGSSKGEVKECTSIGFKSLIIPRFGSGQQGFGPSSGSGEQGTRPPQPGSGSGEQGTRPPQPGSGSGEPGSQSTPQPGLEPEKHGTSKPEVQIFDRCIKHAMRDGTISKSCSHKMQEDKLTQLGYKCNDFGSLEGKVCFCATDLCNEAPKVIGKSKRISILSVIAFVIAHFILNPFF